MIRVLLPNLLISLAFAIAAQMLAEKMPLWRWLLVSSCIGLQWAFVFRALELFH